MKKFIWLLILAVTLNLNADVGYQLDLTSRYIWRGFDLFPQNNPALQPSITYNFGESGFSIQLWCSFSLSKRNRLKYSDEIDLTLTYNFKISEDFSLQAGFTHYGWYFAENFSFKDSTTQEFFVSAELIDVFLRPTLTVYYDTNLGDGFYILLESGHSVKLSHTVTIDLSTSLGYNAGQWVEDSGFSDLNFGVSIPFKLNNLTISPFFNYTLVFLDSINKNNEIWFGISFTL
ncbi:MAG: TorF family putative porin [Candidatus Aminicenantia bacterium]